MNKGSTNKYRRVFDPEELKQPANDNYIQQPSLPLVHSNDNSKEGDKSS